LRSQASLCLMALVWHGMLCDAALKPCQYARCSRTNIEVFASCNGTQTMHTALVILTK